MHYTSKLLCQAGSQVEFGVAGSAPTTDCHHTSNNPFFSLIDTSHLIRVDFSTDSMFLLPQKLVGCHRSCGRRQAVVASASQTGFGKSNKKKVATDKGLVMPKKFKNITTSDLTDEATAVSKQKAADGAPAGFPTGKHISNEAWPSLCDTSNNCILARMLLWTLAALLLPPLTDWIDLKVKASDFTLGKYTKPIELVGRAVMVYKFGDMVFVSDANSTAYQFPMTDARLFKDPDTGRVSAEVPLVRGPLFTPRGHTTSCWSGCGWEGDMHGSGKFTVNRT